MDATLRISKAFNGLSGIVKPANTLLSLDRNARWIDPLLELCRALELFRVQNFNAASPRGRPSVVTARLECINIPQTV